MSQDIADGFHESLLLLQGKVYKEVLNKVTYHNLSQNKDEDTITSYLNGNVGTILNECFKEVRIGETSFFNKMYGSVHYNSHLLPGEHSRRIQIEIGNRSALISNANIGKGADILKEYEIYQKFHIVNLISNRIHPYFIIDDEWSNNADDQLGINKTSLVALEKFLDRNPDIDFIKSALKNDTELFKDTTLFNHGVKFFKQIISPDFIQSIDVHYLIKILIVTFYQTLRNKAVSSNRLKSGLFIPFRYEGGNIYEIGGMAVGFTELIGHTLRTWFVQTCRNAIEPLLFIEGQIQIKKRSGEEPIGTTWGLEVFDVNESIGVNHDATKKIDNILKDFKEIVTTHFVAGNKDIADIIYRKAIVDIWNKLELPYEEADKNEAQKYGENNEYLLPIIKALDMQDTMKYVAGYREHFIHSFYVFMLGYLTIKILYGNDMYKDHNGLTIVNEKNIKDKLQSWFLAALWHDIGYSIEKTEKVLQIYLANIIGEKVINLPLRPSWGHLLLIKNFKRAILFESKFIEFIRDHHCHGNQELAELIMERILYALIDKADHGVISALIFYDIMGRARIINGILPQILSAITLHNSHKHDTWGDLKIKHNGEKEIDARMDYKEDLVSALLMYFDNMQQWSRDLSPGDPVAKLHGLKIEDNAKIRLILDYPNDDREKVKGFFYKHYGDPLTKRLISLENSPFETHFYAQGIDANNHIKF